MPIRSHPTLSALIGESVRHYRQALGLNQDELASRLAKLGSNWQRSAVAELERGARGVSLDEIAFLCAALDISLFQLLEEGETVLVGKNKTSWSLSFLRKQLLETPLPSRDKTSKAVAFELKVGQQSGREAEQKMARLLKVSEMEIVKRSHKLWDRGLTEERNRRVAMRIGDTELDTASLSRIRGHVTRELTKELQDKK